MENYLQHHGIKGQTWGVRRFQNEDGTLTEEGKDRYGIGDGDERVSNSDIEDAKRRYKREQKENESHHNTIKKEKASGKQISERRRQLEEQFLKKGYTKEQAEVSAYKKEKLEKIVKVAGAVAITTALAYGAYKGYKFIQKYGDKVIRKGASVQRVTTNPSDVLLNRPGYVSPDKTDFAKYRGLYGKHIEIVEDNNRFINELAKLTGGHQVPVGSGANVVNAKAVSNLKIAGERTGKKTFDELMKNDPAFKNHFSRVTRGSTPMAGGKLATDYENFNVRLAGGFENPSSKYLKEKFFGALKNKGYAGVIDVNDRRFSGYDSKNPAILFNLKDSLSVQNTAKLGSDMIKKEMDTAYKTIRKQAGRAKVASDFFSKVGRLSLGALGLGSIGVASTAATSVIDNSNAARYRRIINDYKMEHPNTKMTDKQILESLLGA